MVAIWRAALLLAIPFTVLIIISLCVLIILCILCKKRATNRNARSPQHVETEGSAPHALQLELESNTQQEDFMEHRMERNQCYEVSIPCEVKDNPSYQAYQQEDSQIYTVPLEVQSDQLYEALPD